VGDEVASELDELAVLLLLVPLLELLAAAVLLEPFLERLPRLLEGGQLHELGDGLALGDGVVLLAAAEEGDVVGGVGRHLLEGAVGRRHAGGAGRWGRQQAEAGGHGQGQQEPALAGVRHHGPPLRIEPNSAERVTVALAILWPRPARNNSWSVA